jgi:hypothetical protein
VPSETIRVMVTTLIERLVLLIVFSGPNDNQASSSSTADTSSLLARHGTFGGHERWTYGAVIPEFPGFLKKLLETKFGTVVESF